MGSGDHDQEVAKLLDMVAAYSTAPTARNKLDVYQFALNSSTVGWIDHFLEAIASRSDFNQPRVYELAKSFTIDAPDREPVKFGIAVLGLFRHADDLEIFRTLGRHSEFTLFCAVALGNAADDAERELWELARQVDGWGRVHIVERLSQTEDLEIKEWLLREGYKNSVVHEYLAYTCATAGGLLPALEREGIDDELLDSAAELIHALLMGGPAQDIDDYEDGAEAVERFLAHVEQCGTSLTQFLTLVAIKNFLADEKADWGVRAERGWSVDVRQNLVKQASAIIDRPVWREKALSGLKQSNELIFHEANTAAAALGIETWPFHWDRLRNSPKDSGRWFHAMSHCDADHIGDVVALAERELPLAAIASGPADELGLGPEFANHTRLDFILQEMGRFPGLGAKLIAAGLRSPVVRNRNMALSALSKWGRDNWPHGIDALLQAARAAEPCEQVKSRIENVIAGKPLE
jgi:hypothetical protein